jgi:hypothetical protein
MRVVARASHSRASRVLTHTLVTTQRHFKQLAEALAAHGVQSPYLARIETRIAQQQRLELLQTELNQDLAGALGQTDLRVNFALAELELRKARYERALRDGVPERERSALASAFNQQRLAAEKCLRELLIQREAVGFRRNQVLEELYPIAPKLRLPEQAPSSGHVTAAADAS